MKELKEIEKDIQTGKLKPVYAFDGEESYYIDVLTDYFENNLLTESERDFNQTIFYGKDVEWNVLVNECRSYPAFAQRRLVILKEANQMKDFSMLDAYIQQPSDSTVLVIAYKYKKIDGRLAIVKSIAKNGKHFTFNRLKDHLLSQWIIQYCTDHHRKISPRHADIIAAHIGNDLQKISNEIDKTIINLKEGEEISEALIEEYIGISKDYNIFQFPKAILEKNTEKAFTIAKYFMANEKNFHMTLVTATLYGEFSKLYQYHYVAHLPASQISSTIKVPPFYLDEYRMASVRFDLNKTKKAIDIIHTYNLYAVGIGMAHHSASLLKELTSKLLAL